MKTELVGEQMQPSLDVGDPERAQAQVRAVALGLDPRHAATMSDAELRAVLDRASRRDRNCALLLPLAQRLTMEGLKARLTALHQQHQHGAGSSAPAQGESLPDEDPQEESDLIEVLCDQYGVTVAADGLVEVERFTRAAIRLIGPVLPVALYHHTSTALLDRISRDGLRVGRPTNFFNTQAGVYLSTIASGVPVGAYSARAARVHGGDPCTLRVKRRLWQIRPDPDDQDLVWAQGRQFVTPQVPPEDIRWDDPVLHSLALLQGGRRVVESDDALGRLRTEGAWFQGSVATDGLGLPMALYHGTSAYFERFADNDKGIWMAEDPEQAALFSGIRSGAPRVLKLHASIRRPWIVVRYGSEFPYSRMLDQAIPALKALGYDGIYRPQDRVWVAFEPHQVRSAFTPEHGEGEGQDPEKAEASSVNADRRHRA